MLLLLSTLFIATAVFLVGEVAMQPSRDRRRALRRAQDYGHVEVRGAQVARFRERVILPVMHHLASLAFRLSPRVTHDMIAARLLAAGMGRRMNANGFLAMKGLLGVGGFVLGIMVGGAIGGPGGALLFGVALTVLGFVVPGLVISSKTKARRELLRQQLPDALDLLAVSVEAGLGFDGAISKLTEHTEGALTEEFALTLNEMRIGESRQEALKKLADRAAAPEVAHFSRAIVQADQLGISLGRILKVQAADQRARRQLAAEEKAMKAPIKMLFPLVLFIFPAMFMVILGPAFLNLSKLF